ncbi:DUF2505 domain-containing protein [Naumannella halotolerans]|uniref:Uncharacterized protein DUF2505 n=1 Tax=Naumannella halotolerans TaxID=993414 RepID=A0A4R7J8X3_9ACTN|nr:DUF2505 domain-containing protein [Naumannella halotolerans]TDT33734.1 uncharacterized protein DUF2505 [Naumannella halotolerans]
MQITSSATFSASADAVFAMLTDEAYLTEVCRASDATDYSVSSDGTTTRTSRTLAAPKEAARFTGPTLVVTEQIVWGSAAADGSRNGQLTLGVQGQPVTMNGTTTIHPSGQTTTVDVDGELKVNIPLLGGKLEKAAAPAILEGIKLQQEVGNRWLAR